MVFYYRRAAARGVLDAFKQSCFAEEDTMNVIAVIEQLVNDQGKFYYAKCIMYLYSDKRNRRREEKYMKVKISSF